MDNLVSYGIIAHPKSVSKDVGLFKSLLEFSALSLT
jgi:hypothetical protein